METSLPQVVSVHVRQHADAHLSFRVNGERVDAAAADVDFVADCCGAVELLCYATPLRYARGVCQIKLNDLFWMKTNFERALRTINARVHHGIVLELDANLLFCKALHVQKLVLVYGDCDRLEFHGKVAL